MANTTSSKNVTAIVPAHNEEPRIASVLQTLTTSPMMSEVIVVDDGSTDSTAKIAKTFPVKYIYNTTRRGKGYAMNRGVKEAKNDVIFFCDADVKGLTHEVIKNIVMPVTQGRVDMFIGMRNRKYYIIHYIVTLVPLLGGERAVTKELWGKIPEYYKQHFRIEAALNFYALYYGKGFQYKILKGVSQVIKERKYGMIEGTIQRWKMMYNVVSAQIKLQILHIPKSARNRRILAFISIQSIAGIVIGAMVCLAAYWGPVEFIQRIFATELQQDPSAPIVNTLLHFTQTLTSSAVLIIGVMIIVANMITLSLTFAQLGAVVHRFMGRIKNNKTDSTIVRATKKQNQ